MQYASMRQARDALDHLEKIRLGEPAFKFQQATESMVCDAVDVKPHCEIMAVPYRSEKALLFLSKLPIPLYSKLRQVLPRVGLQLWDVRTTAVIKNGTLEFLTVGFYVEGRRRTVGSGWFLSPELPERVTARFQFSSGTATATHWFNITSYWPGEGYEFYVTPRSTDSEMSVRYINRKCLSPFHTCEDIGELLPNATAFLRQPRH